MIDDTYDITLSRRRAKRANETRPAASTVVGGLVDRADIMSGTVFDAHEEDGRITSTNNPQRHRDLETRNSIAFKGKGTRGFTLHAAYSYAERRPFFLSPR